MNFIILGVLLILSACFSGLNLGMMSLGPHDLKRKMQMGDKRAAKIYPIRKKGNLLLVTLLLGNVAVNAAIAIFMSSVASGLVAGIVSTLLITIFGEILPQAVFSRFALSIGSRIVWLVKIFIFILYPIAAPLAFLLNKLLGDELPTIFSRNELREIISEHSESPDSDIEADESDIARGAFTFGSKTVKEVMIPRSLVISVNADEVLDKKKLGFIGKYGYPRIPVIDKHSYEVKGLIHTYDLLNLKNLNKLAIDICEKKLFYVKETDKLAHVLKTLIKYRHHLFVVINDFDEYSGIITVEDILEEILGKEIIDENDIVNTGGRKKVKKSLIKKKAK